MRLPYDVCVTVQPDCPKVQREWDDLRATIRTFWRCVEALEIPEPLVAVLSSRAAYRLFPAWRAAALIEKEDA